MKSLQIRLHWDRPVLQSLLTMAFPSTLGPYCRVAPTSTGFRQAGQLRQLRTHLNPPTDYHILVVKHPPGPSVEGSHRIMRDSSRA